MSNLDIQKWKLKYIHQINESDDEDFNITIGSWDDFNPEYQELEDQFGPNAASQLRNKFKDKIDSPKNLSNELLGKSEFWFDMFMTGIENGEDANDAWSAADMYQQDEDDINRGLELAQKILNRPDWKFKGEDEYDNADQLWDQMNQEDNDYYNDMDTSPSENLFDKLIDMIEYWTTNNKTNDADNALLERWAKLAGLLKENNDEFDNVNIPNEWDVEELKAGKMIKPNMWNHSAFLEDNPYSGQRIYDEFTQDSLYIRKIWWIGNGDDYYAVDLRDKNNRPVGYTGTPNDVDEINMLLKPQYRIFTDDIDKIEI